MKNMTLENIAKACNGKYVGKDADRTIEITGGQVDSRKIKEGNLFFASKGEKVDGHSFIAKAFELGAACAVCEREIEAADGPYILVENSLQALKSIAAFYRDQLTIPIVGITGSVGKTSTKEAIAAVLSAKYRVQKTDGNFNNEVGLPLTMLTIQDEHEVAVVEMGISDFGEMDRLAAISRPDVCVITNIGLCHLENLKTQQGIMKAKTEMFNHRNPKGAVILNGDDPLLSTISDVDGTKPVRFGYSDGCDVRVTESQLLGLRGVDFTVKTPDGHDLMCHSKLPGNHTVTNAACAAAVASVLGLTDGEIKQGITMQAAVKGRSNIIEANELTIIDDCYNANPVSMKEAVDLLSLSDDRRVAVLGDMFELGENETQLHYEVGKYIADSSVDLLLTAGALSENIYQGAGNVEKHHYSDRDSLIADLKNHIKKGDSILVKASHGMHFENIVEVLTTRL